MGKRMNETYKAFQLVRVCGPKNQVWEGSRYYKREDKAKGRCCLELIIEAIKGVYPSFLSSIGWIITERIIREVYETKEQE